MRIAILTHPLIGNFGGILQAKALCSYLETMGHQVILLDRRPNRSLFKRIIIELLAMIGINKYKYPYKRYALQRCFIDNHINRTSEICSSRILVRQLRRHHIDCVVIGSDQVWNHQFVQSSSLDYWGAFLPLYPIPTVAYGASLGSDKWMYNKEQTVTIYSLLPRFKGVSVREYSATILLENKVNVKAQWVLDPTLLQTVDFYNQFAAPPVCESPYVFVYWLGDEKVIANLQERYPKHRILRCKLGEEENSYSVERWISAIKHADVVVTDSFHGCVLSILYHRHFVPYQNIKGGVTRLHSLFEMLGLESKFVLADAIEDYDSVEYKLSILRTSSRSFLADSIARCNNKVI